MRAPLTAPGDRKNTMSSYEGKGANAKTAQLGKTTANWKQRTLRFLHLVLAIETPPVFTPCSAQLANGAQTAHTPCNGSPLQKKLIHGKWVLVRFTGSPPFRGFLEC